MEMQEKKFGSYIVLFIKAQVPNNLLNLIYPLPNVHPNLRETIRVSDFDTTEKAIRDLFISDCSAFLS